MRSVFTLATLTALLLPNAADSQKPDPAAHLYGKWKCLRAEMPGGTKSDCIDGVMTLEGGNVSWKMGNGQMSSGGRYHLDPNANPPRMDINHCVGIYRMDADTLVVCLWLNAGDLQTTFDVPKQNPPATVVFTFRRVSEPALKNGR